MRGRCRKVAAPPYADDLGRHLFILGTLMHRHYLVQQYDK